MVLPHGTARAHPPPCPRPSPCGPVRPLPRSSFCPGWQEGAGGGSLGGPQWVGQGCRAEEGVPAHRTLVSLTQRSLLRLPCLPDAPRWLVGPSPLTGHTGAPVGMHLDSACGLTAAFPAERVPGCAGTGRSFEFDGHTCCPEGSSPTPSAPSRARPRVGDLRHLALLRHLLIRGEMSSFS